MSTASNIKLSNTIKGHNDFDMCASIKQRQWSEYWLAEVIISKRDNNASLQVILTLYPNLELPALSEPTLDNASLACRQCDLQPHKELKVGLLLEQAAANHSIIVSHLSTRD